MPVFLHRLVVIPDGPVRHELDMVSVVVAVVVVVVARSRRDG